MTYFVYITDSISVAKMECFWNKNMVGQNKKEDLNQWIGGEYYINTSLYMAIKDISTCSILHIDTLYDNHTLDDASFIIVPGWATIPAQFIQYRYKMYSYRYFEGATTDFSGKHILTPYKYNQRHTFLPVSVIPATNTIDITTSLNGVLIGKCISHTVARNKHTQLLSFIDGVSHKLVSTLRPLHLFDTLPSYLESQKNVVIEYSDKIINHPNIESRGVLNPEEFRQLLTACKYCIFYHGAFAPPTLLEALYSRCIILATQSVVPTDLLYNKNIILIDDMSNEHIYTLIDEIEQGIRIFDENSLPQDYTVDNKIAILQSLA